MVERRIRSGDRVRHIVRPEWGVGVVINSEPVSVDGALRQRFAGTPLLRAKPAGLRRNARIYMENEA